MKCLRCGYCCMNLSVIVVDDPQEGIIDGNLIPHNGENTKCKHLAGEKPGEYTCNIHNEEWYNETPCYSHGQIEANTKCNCRMGQYILERGNPG